MLDRFDEMRAALRSDAGKVHWADPAEVRGRGAHRAHRRLAVIGLLATLTVSGGIGTGAAAVLIDRETTPAPPLPLRRHLRRVPVYRHAARPVRRRHRSGSVGNRPWRFPTAPCSSHGTSDPVTEPVKGRLGWARLEVRKGVRRRPLD